MKHCKTAILASCILLCLCFSGLAADIKWRYLEICDNGYVKDAVKKGANVNEQVAINAFGKMEPVGPPLVVLTDNCDDNSATTQIALFLISKGANVNLRSKGQAGWTPLHNTIIMNKIGLTKLLIAKGADVNVKNGEGDTPLHVVPRAIYNIPGPVVEKESRVKEFAALLLNHKANINATNNKGQTPLDIATDVVGIKSLRDYLASRGAKSGKIK